MSAYETKEFVTMASQVLSHLEPLLGVQDLAALLGTTRRAVYHLRERAVLPRAILVGGKLYWRRSDIEAWLDSNTEERVG